ncbi:MAG: P-protein [Candidatus Latescibacteria bacterium ADurb.Bin168]|nr:MAG: P-protein [Candidatus Latescibacteria bacterium ADurb.Bin168]
MVVVAFQGELGAFSEAAARAYFGNGIDLSPSATFREVFLKVSNGEADRGVIPIENSLAGSVHENYDLLLEHNLHIVGEVKLRIVHHLVANKGVALPDVRRVFSHPQALAQCQEFLRGLSGVTPVPVYDTAGAAKELKASGMLDAAAISSAQAAMDYELEILASGIESNHQNFTRFLIVALDPDAGSGRPGNKKVSVAFALRHAPGTLFKSIGVFALRDIDLLKIESRPIPGTPWQYLFYLDFAGDVEEPRVGKALDHLGELTSFLRVLGCYPIGDTIDSATPFARERAGQDSER